MDIKFNQIKTLLFFAIPGMLYLGASSLPIPINEALLLVFVLSAVLFWATSIIPDYQTSLYFLFGCFVFSLAPNAIIFSGLYSCGFWLVFSGMIMSVAIKKIHIDLMISRILGMLSVESYAKVLFLTSVFSISLCFVIPSALSRMFLLVPVLEGISASFGYKKASRGRDGIIIAGVLVTTLAGYGLLPSNLPNMILSGLAEHIYDHNILYSYYFISNFLVLGLGKSVFVVILVHHFFQEPVQETIFLKGSQEIEGYQKLIGMILFLVVLLWMTDAYHGISPCVVGVIGVLLLSHPAVNAVDKEDYKAVSFPTLLFIAGLVGLGNIVSQNQLIKEFLSQIIGSFSSFNQPFFNYMAITLGSAVSGICILQPTIPALFTPFASQLASLTGFTLDNIFMMEVASFSTIFFVYQAPPMVVGLELAQVSSKKVFYLLLLQSLFSIVVLFPLHYFLIRQL